MLMLLEMQSKASYVKVHRHPAKGPCLKNREKNQRRKHHHPVSGLAKVTKMTLMTHAIHLYVRHSKISSSNNTQHILSFK